MSFFIPIMLIIISNVQIYNSTFHFNPDEVTLRDDGIYTVICGEKFEGFGRTNEPMLPGFKTAFILPWNSEVIDIEIIGSNPYIIGKAELPKPGDPPNPIGIPQRNIGYCNPEFYNSTKPYPYSFLASSHLGNESGFKIFSAFLLPVKWDPVTKNVILYRDILVQVKYRETDAIHFNSVLRDKLHKKLISFQIDNPENINSWAPPIYKGNVDYLVIAPESLIQTTALDSLINLRASQSLLTDTISLERIQNTMTGFDTPEKIRNYLIQRYQQDGLTYALLIGDENIMEPRDIWTCAHDSDGTPWSDSSPSDLYFADLDGDWNYNADNRYGQPDDSLDLYADIFVGRLPVSSSSELSNCVQKIYTYETNPPAGSWQTTSILAGAILFPSYNYTGEACCESIATRLPATWHNIKLYEACPHGPAPLGTIDSLNNGAAWTQWCGHGNRWGVWWGSSSSIKMLYYEDILLMTNGGKLAVHTSIACMPGAFHLGICAVKPLMNLNNAGGIVCTFNTSYGWEGYLAQGEMGPSEFMDIWFAEAVFDSSIVPLGPAFYAAKARRVPFWDHNFYGGYDRNLSTIIVLTYFGDPALNFIGSGSSVEEEINEIIFNPNIKLSVCNFRLNISLSGQAEVEVFDISGRKTLERIFTDNLDEDISYLPSGHYFCIISIEGRYFSRSFKLIK